jgi:hypothetical protein
MFEHAFAGAVQIHNASGKIAAAGRSNTRKIYSG